MSQANASRWATASLLGLALVLAAVNALPSQPLPAEGVEYAEAVFFVKFTEPARRQIALSKSEHTGRTGIASVDRLNEAARVQRIVPVFRHGGKFEARHRAYGLDRWYRVYTDGSVEISDVLGRYRSDPNILSAELQAIPSLDVLPEEILPRISLFSDADRPLQNGFMTEDGPSARLTPNDPLLPQQWSFDNAGQDGGTVDADIDLPEAWTIETGKPSVIVAVLDTGLDPDHPDLAPNIWRNPGEIPDNGLDDDDNGYVDDTWGWDFFNDDNDPTYGEGHGTHTSGTVVAATNNETGVAGVAGGWGPDDLGARVMVLAGHWGYPEAIVYAADNGATIASYSWSGTTFTFQIVEDAFRYFIDNAAAPDGSMQGGMIIFSAGNEGTNQWQYPKAYSEVIAVSATDRKDLRPSWSNYGEWVDVAAPGVSVLSTFIHDSYRVFTGTSMAAPHVAGVAALVRSARPDLPAAAVRYVLEHTTDLSPQKGRLNAHRALEMATGDLPDLYAEPPDLNFRTVTSGTERSMRVTLWNIGSFDHTVTLASGNPRFQANATEVRVPAGSTAAFEVVFSPTRKELEEGILTLNAGAETIQLSLRGDAHEFTDHYAVLQDVSFPSLEWADFDNDGDLDLLLTGESGSPAFKERHAIIYTNNGDQTFSDAGVELNGVTNGQGSWIDFDNDGDFDLLLTGESTATFDTRLFRNDGDGLYIAIETNLPPLVESSVAWGDFDNDGFRDLAIMGADPPYQSQPQRHLLIYRNRGGTDFEQVALLHGVSSGDLAWSDYDNDGDVDLVACGWNGVERSTILYRNDNGLLTESGVSLAPVKDCSVTWGDLDSDGDADLLLTGETTSGATTVLYRNDGNGTLTDIGQNGLSPARVGSASFGDYDNDGDLDILLTGYSGVVRFSRVWHNNGAFSFTAIESFVGLATSAGAWADFDLDGDLDAIVAGQDQAAKYTRLYRNEGASRPNTQPEPPSGLSASVSGGNATLSWSTGSDAETPAASLTYELRIGSVPGESNVVSSRAAGDGRRLVVDQGSVGHVRSWTIRNLENGTYYWTVQSVDNGFSGSPFAPEATFTITDSPIVSPNLTEVVLRSPADSATGEPTTISLSWVSVPEARFYQVQVSATEDFGAIVLDEMSIASATDFVTPVAERRYHWRVRAFRGESVGPWSTPWTFVTGALGGYSVQLVSPEDGIEQVVQPLTFVWTVAPKASEYELQVASSPNFQSPEVVRGHLTSRQQTVSGLSPGARFYWRVRGIGPTGEGTWTTTRTFETLALPGVVSLLEPLDRAIDQEPNVTLRWSAADLADSYRLQVDSTESFLDPLVDDSTVTGVAWTSGDSFVPGITYSWRVRAQNAAGSGTWSDPWQFTVARSTGISDESFPAAFRLYPVYPDPAADRFTVAFDLPEPASVRVALFDVLGRHQMDLLRADLRAAHHERVFTVGSVASGLYLIRVETADFIDAVPLLIIRP